MKLRIASDLHLEGWSNSTEELVRVFLPAHEDDGQSVLVLAGDISSNVGQLVSFLQAVESRFVRVLYVPGNHEYYRQDMKLWNTSAQADILSATSNVVMCAGGLTQVVIEGTRFLLDTFWADGGRSEFERIKIELGINDFRGWIKLDGQDYKVKDMKTIHAAAVKAMGDALNDSMEPTVVVTHHLPSYTLCHPRFDGSYNGAFASNSDILMYRDSAPKLWIHGHTHDSIDKVIGKTRVVANPRGYVTEWKSAFNAYQPKFIDLEAL